MINNEKEIPIVKLLIYFEVKESGEFDLYSCDMKFFMKNTIRNSVLHC